MASALWLVIAIVGGLVYPALVQWAVVRPNQGEREATYIARNVEATRQALGLDKVIVQPVQFARLSTKNVADDLQPIKNVRLLNPTQMLSRFTFDRGEKTGLVIADLDVDRYVLDSDKPEQVLIAARELDISTIPNKSWQGKHLASTRGCGLVMAPASRVTTQDRPQYRDVALDRPELYFSPETSSYAVARTDVGENPCGSGDPYTGTSGVRISGLARRGAFALAFLDYNLLGSGAINGDSEMLWVRSVEDRVKKLAPFLHFDGDPYPVVVNGGVQWVIDAYTSTSRYPYAQRIGNIQLSDQTGLPRDSNYVRNSVKAVVDAYTGDVTFYVVDETDPIVRAWQSAFHDLFTPLDKMPAELKQHLRYPEDLFRVQTELYSKYQVDASEFFSRNGAWSVAQAPSIDRQDRSTGATTAAAGADEQAAGEFATESNSERFTPYYTLFRSGLTGKEEFVILRPFVPFSTNDGRTELQAYLTASSDPDTYGKLGELRGSAGPTSTRAVARRRPGRVGAEHQPATVAASEPGDGDAGRVRRSATCAGGRRVAVHPARLRVLVRRARVPVRDRVDRQQRRDRHRSRERAGAAVPRLRGTDRRPRARHRRRHPIADQRRTGQRDEQRRVDH